MTEVVMVGTVVTGVGAAVLAAKLTVSWVLDRIPARQN